MQPQFPQGLIVLPMFMPLEGCRGYSTELVTTDLFCFGFKNLIRPVPVVLTVAEQARTWVLALDPWHVTRHSVMNGPAVTTNTRLSGPLVPSIFGSHAQPRGDIEIPGLGYIMLQSISQVISWANMIVIAVSVFSTKAFLGSPRVRHDGLTNELLRVR
jgi:hypothetical protein